MQTPIYGNQGGTTLTVGSGGTLVIATGGAIEVEDNEAIADLNQDISASYTEAEVQAISDKVDLILDALRTAGIIPLA